MGFISQLKLIKVWDQIIKTNNKYTNKDFGDALKDLKEKSGLSYKQIEIKSGLSAPYIFDLANKKKLPPKDKNIIKIAKALKVKSEYFKEYRQRKLAKKLYMLKDYYDVVLSDEEAEFLDKIVKKHFKKI